jgi:hypothetical protein
MFAVLTPDVRNYQANCIAAGGAPTAQRLLALNWAVLNLRSAGLRSKMTWMWLPSGGSASIHVPFIRSTTEGGTTIGLGSQTGIVSGDYSEANGWVQGGTTGKYITTGVRLTDAGLLGACGASYHTGDLSAHRALMGASTGTTTADHVLLLDYRRAAADIGGVFRTPATGVNPQPAEGLSSAGTANRIAGNRSSTTNLGYFQRGVRISTNTTNQTGTTFNSTRAITLGLRDTNGALAQAAAATLTSAFITATSLTDAEMTTLDGIIAEMLSRAGLPTSS